ncbi:SMI1/KNR4 family protein [Enterocloster clostridioformis]|uniref:SMI1/KNR4 family protein n=1 Tax=Enterocloster clostridioformis TaxID=1531 RepID=UPI0022E31E35|nr:SMI1/KNR4 family protein [Enterocloster clostridioformis]
MFEFMKMKGFFVKDSDVEQAQNKLKVIFPEQLKLFWKEIGFGNLAIEPGDFASNWDKFFSPEEVVQLRRREGEFAQYARYLSEGGIEEREAEGDLVFFQINHATYLTISPKENGRIYYYDLPIAESLEDFFRKDLKKYHYFYDLYAEEKKDILDQIKRLKGMDLG